jgi:hypothetical protein
LRDAFNSGSEGAQRPRHPPACPHCKGITARPARSAGQSNRPYLPVLQAIENQFDAAGDAQFIEDPEQVISDDLVVARGYSPRDVVLTFYALTTGLVGAGWISLRIASSAAILLATACWVVLGFWAIHLGALRSGDDANPVRARAAFEL